MEQQHELDAPVWALRLNGKILIIGSYSQLRKLAYSDEYKNLSGIEITYAKQNGKTAIETAIATANVIDSER